MSEPSRTVEAAVIGSSAGLPLLLLLLLLDLRGWPADATCAQGAS
jgi:hypothetical protein